MAADLEVLTLSDAAPSQAQQSFRAIASVLSTQLPYAEIEHVGSTAVPGCLTKGDLDVLVRVTRPDFQGSMLALDGLLTRSTRNEQTDEYAEYDYSVDGVSASVQLVVAGGSLDDRFHRLKAILRSDTEALATYNSLKAQCDGGSMTAYRRAKANLIDSFLGTDSPVSDGSDQLVLRPGVHE
jgi:GrpB-like predicted nucleotidyltransferase (UPF0157 family)